jgi:hypothetical protein
MKCVPQATPWMIRLLVCGLAASMTASLSADYVPDPETMDKIIAAGEKLVPQEIRDQKALLAKQRIELNATKRAAVNANANLPELNRNGVIAFHTQEEKQKAIDGLSDSIQNEEHYIADLSDRTAIPSPELTHGPFSSGDCGRLSRPVRIVRTLDDQSQIVQYDGDLYWLGGFSTKGMAKGSYARIHDPIIFTKSKTFGSEMVLCAEPVDWQAVLAYRQQKMKDSNHRK